MKKALKIARPLCIIIGTFYSSLFLSENSQIKNTKIIESEFVFTSTGVLLGFAFSLLAFIVSMLDKISIANIDHKSRAGEKKRIIKMKVALLNKEIRDNIYFIFLSLVLSGFIILIEKSDIPYLNSLQHLLHSKSDILTAVKLTIVTLNIYAIYDLLGITFKVSNATADIDNGSTGES